MQTGIIDYEDGEYNDHICELLVDRHHPRRIGPGQWPVNPCITCRREEAKEDDPTCFCVVRSMFEIMMGDEL